MESNKMGKKGGLKSVKNRFENKTKEEISEIMKDVRNGKIICIDFDGTICKQQSFGDGLIHEKPKENVKEALTKLKNNNYKIVILTTRLNPSLEGDVQLKKQRLEAWLKQYQIPYDEITNNKPRAKIYIDNRAIKFNDWDQIINDLKID